MKWEGHRQSKSVEDRRGVAGGGGRMSRMGGRGLGVGTIVVALLAGWAFGINPLTVLGLLSQGEQGAVVQQASTGANTVPANDRAVQFAVTVLADTEDGWNPLFRASQGQYREPTLVLFRGSTPTACGTGQRAMGPFYCPGDSKVYLDLGFFDALAQRLGAPGDFAQAYVVAHEAGHHIQNLLGVTQRMDAMRGRASPAQLNAMSVRLELQADCLAGVWAHHSQRCKGWLEAGDIEEAMNAAAQVGDDALRRQGGGTVRPESFAHGTSVQRQTWFRRGLDGGQMAQCNTFDARNL